MVSRGLKVRPVPLMEGFHPETELFEQHNIPWGEIAFPVVVQTLERYFKDRVSGQYIPLNGTILSRCKLA